MLISSDSKSGFSVAALASLLLFGCPSLAETMAPIDPKSALMLSDFGEAFRILYCQPDSPGPGHVIAVLSKDYEATFLVGTDAGEDVPVISTYRSGGRLVVSGPNYTYLSPTSAEVGTCEDFTQTTVQVMQSFAAQTPDRFRVFLLDAIGGPETWRAATEQRMAEMAMENGRLTLDLFDAQAELKKLRSTEPVKQDSELLRDLEDSRKEQDRLKRMICKLNPKATFTVCEETK